MGLPTVTFLFCTAAALTLVASQSLPRRLQIPGAIPLGSPLQDARPIQYRRPAPQPLSQQDYPVPTRIRSRPPSPQLIQGPVRPVFEEQDDEHNGPLSRDEVARVASIPVVSPPPQRVQQQQARFVDEDEEENVAQRAPQPIQFRPAPVVRLQAQPIPIRQPQPQRVAQVRPRPHHIASDDNEKRPRHSGRTTQPPVKILRKYRDDNPDGSITWGFENDDGTFKEENIGVDCVIRGKYGYIDPDGNRREYSYETGNRCDIKEEEEDDDDLPLAPQRPKYQQPQPKPRPVQNLPQIRLQ